MFIQDNVSLIDAVLQIEQRLIIWQLQFHLPAEYKILRAYTEALPFNWDSPIHPFAGVVINFCVSTNAHRDKLDKRICIVIPFGEWEGGEICLYELGLVIKLKAGDVLVFPSCDITHFNMHFNGLRGSLVLHSDRLGDSWVEGYNGWRKHIVHEDPEEIGTGRVVGDGENLQSQE